MNEHLPDPDGIAVNLDKPSAARVYDYLLGGGHSFGADRALAAPLKDQVPHATRAAQQNRAFLRRVVLHLLDHGIRQFLDLGSGIPTVGNIHDIVAQRDPRCIVVHVDTDPVAVAHSQIMLQQSPNAAAVQADLRNVDTVMTHSTVRARIDFAQPMAVLMCAVLHFLDDDDDPARIVRRYVDRLPAGSYLAITHLTADDHPHDVAAAIDLYRNGGIAVTARTKTEVTALFTGMNLIEPGVVHASQWRPEYHDDLEDPTHCLSYAGLATTTDPS